MMKPLFLLLALLGVLEVQSWAGEKPNVLLIVSDDHGYADVGFNGSKDIFTPNLDALAKSGVLCTSGYVSHPFCSPTRAGLMTGRYQQRFGHENNPAYKPQDPTEGLPLSERLLPQYLQQAGWKTGWIGKWHLGATPPHAPGQRGFEQCFGFIGGGHKYLGWSTDQAEYTIPIRRDGEVVEVPGHLTTRLGAEAAGFVQRNAAAPWFLYLAFNAPHSPQEPTPEALAKFASIQDPERRKYAAQISLLDDAIGTVIAALGKSGQTQRTLVFFFSDNGGIVNNEGRQFASNAPLKGGKGTVYEGGVRVPFLVSWPGKLTAGTHYDAPVSSLDVFATTLALAEVAMPKDKIYDSVNLIPHLTGEIKAPPHERLFWRTGGGAAHAVREGQYKLIRRPNHPAELYDLSTDIGERKDLAAALPEIVARLSATLDTWDKELIPPAFAGLKGKREEAASAKNPKNPAP